MTDKDYAIYAFGGGEPTEGDLRAIEAYLADQRLKMLKEIPIETDEDYQKLGELFDEDE